MMKHNHTLAELANKLLNVSDNEEANEIMSHIHELLDEGGVTISDRKLARQTARDIVRNRVLYEAARQAEATPRFFKRSMPALIDAESELSGMCAALTPRPVSEDVQGKIRALHPMFESISAGETAENVRAVTAIITGHLDVHPDIREAGYRRLLQSVQDEIIAGYMPISLKLPAEEWNRHYYTSLLSCLECDYPEYAFDFLYYEDGVFSIADAESIANERDAERMKRKLEIYCRAMAMHPSIEEAMAATLDDAVHLRVLDWLDRIPEAIDLPEHIHTCIGLLRRELDGELLDMEAGNAEPESTFRLVAALSLISSLSCENNPEFLINSWMELCNIAELCPACGEYISAAAASALQTHIISGVLEAGMALPETLEILLRFTMAMSVSNRRAALDGITFQRALCYE